MYFAAFYDPFTHSKEAWFDSAFWKKFGTLEEEKDKAKDPATKATKEKEIDALFNQAEAPALKRSKRLLRLQVRDFIDWLKGQGVI